MSAASPCCSRRTTCTTSTRLAQRVIVIGHGRVLADGTFDALRARIASEHSSDEDDATEPLAIEEVIARFYHLHGATEA